LLQVERIQQQLQRVGELAEQSERLAVLGTMAASIAHEINNILTPVKAYAELALSNPGDRGLVVKALERAAQGVDRATRIAEMILACSREGERMSDGGCGMADVGEVARRAVGALPSDPGGAFPVEMKVVAGCLAAMDGVALEQVILNLLLNARAAMGGGGRTIVSALTNERGVVIEVRDFGCGIPAARVGKIFDAFVSYSAEDVREGGKIAGVQHRRTGLGLPICKRLVEDAGGRIEVESEVGKGTCVRVVVPGAVGERKAA
jgi:signal transduction histidine kinase